MLTLSIFISWIFAKSVTNAANLGAQYGLVGGVAYAVYWLCIPLAGVVIYRLRRRFGATGLVSFLTEKYGRAAAVAFSAAILIRLFNEVWSNTAVVGGYYGESGSRAFVCAALLFTLVTVAYSVRGGLLSSVVTDALQAIVFIAVMIYVVVAIIPQHSVGSIMTSGEWKLDAGVDLLLVSALQILSYPFHDPVLTDRGFICEEKPMLVAFFVSGILGFLSIVFFSTVGIHASLIGSAVWQHPRRACEGDRHRSDAAYDYGHGICGWLDARLDLLKPGEARGAGYSSDDGTRPGAQINNGRHDNHGRLRRHRQRPDGSRN